MLRAPFGKFIEHLEAGPVTEGVFADPSSATGVEIQVLQLNLTRARPVQQFPVVRYTTSSAPDSYKR